MKETERILKLLSDGTRLRIIMILLKKGTVCMPDHGGAWHIAAACFTQSHTSQGRSRIPQREKDGKLVFYSVKKAYAPGCQRKIISLIEEKP